MLAAVVEHNLLCSVANLVISPEISFQPFKVHASAIFLHFSEIKLASIKATL